MVRTRGTSVWTETATGVIRGIVPSAATAVATNWLMLVPSALLISATAAFNDVGSRNG